MGGAGRRGEAHLRGRVRLLCVGAEACSRAVNEGELRARSKRERRERGEATFAPTQPARTATPSDGECVRPASQLTTRSSKSRGFLAASRSCSRLECDVLITGVRRTTNESERGRGEQGVSTDQTTARRSLTGAPPQGALPPLVATLYRRKSATKPATMPSWILPAPLPVCTDRVNRDVVLDSDVLKLSNALLCARESRGCGVRGRRAWRERAEGEEEEERDGGQPRVPPRAPHSKRDHAQCRRGASSVPSSPGRCRSSPARARGRARGRNAGVEPMRRRGDEQESALAAGA